MSNSIDAITNEVVQMQLKAQQKKREYLQDLLDLGAEVEPTKFLFSIGGVPTIPAGELIGVKGRAKMGKSQFVYYLVGAMLAGRQCGSVTPLESNGKVLLFDTEQSRQSIQTCCRRALQLARRGTSTNYADFMPFSMRGRSPEERKELIMQAVEAERPTIVVIDGIRDILHNFNDLNESSSIIQWLLSLTADYGCTVMCVLHQNKSLDDGNMRGHLGTELLNKLSDCFEVKKKDGCFVVTCTDSRNVPCPEMVFKIDTDGNFSTDNSVATVTDKTAEREAKRADETRSVIGLCFKEKSSMRYSELVEAYTLEGAVSERTAKERVKDAKTIGLISVQNGLYSLAPM